MKELSDDFIQSGTLNSSNNTWGGRYNAAIPYFNKKGSFLEVQANGVTTSITSYDEITLFLLVKYLFIPAWLVEQWYETGTFDIIGIKAKNGRDKIKDWVKLNLCWLESTPTGIYLRPTKALFQMFNYEMDKYTNIPTNTLTHTVSEISVSHDIMSGQHPILKRFKVLPRQSFLGLPPQEIGTNIICEADFRNPAMWSEQGMQKVIEIEKKIDEGILEGKTVTPELTDFRYFSVIKKVDDTGIPKKDYVSHVPDIVIPMIRECGQPRSIAIEVELTSKGIRGYEESIKRFKDNNKFGFVIYLCGGPGVAESLKKAYRNIGGSGMTKFIIMEYVIPQPQYKF